MCKRIHAFTAGDKERVSKIWTQIYRAHGTP